MILNSRKEEMLPNDNTSLDIDKENIDRRPKTINSNEQAREKFSFSGTSISSNKIKENESYNNFISRIKLNYNLTHPRKRIQTIILHSNPNSDKSQDVNKSLLDNLTDEEIEDIWNEVVNQGLNYDNSGQVINNNNKRRRTNHFNRENEERLQKGVEEKNNHSAEVNKKKIINNSNNDYKNNNNSKINLGNVFNSLNESNENEKVMLIDNSFSDNQWMNNDEKDGSRKTNNVFNSYKYKDNPFLGSNTNKYEQFQKGNKDMNINYVRHMNNMSSNINTHDTNDNHFPNKIIHKNEKTHISSFNNGMNNNSFPNPRNSYSGICNNTEENINKSNNDYIKYGNHFTLNEENKEINDNQYELNKNISQNNRSNQNIPREMIFNNNNENIGFQNNQEKNKSKGNKLDSKPNNTHDNLDNNNNDENIEYNNIEDTNKYKNNDQMKLNMDKRGNNEVVGENNINNINKNTENNGVISLTVSEIDEEDLDIDKKRKGKNLLKSFLYGLLFGSTATGIFWLKDEETRKYLYEKIKGINFNSIINFLKRVFVNPIEFFKKIFNNERMKDYLRVFGMTLTKFFDFFEGYDDWFRLIGIVLSVYLIWIIIKTFIRAIFKVWKYYN